jgi:hypothetical protein
MLLMELSTQSAHQKTRSPIKCAVSQPSSILFRDLVSAFHTAWDTYLQCTGHIGMDEKCLAALKDDAKEKQRAVDWYNQYSISVCGVSVNVYGGWYHTRIPNIASSLFTNLLRYNSINATLRAFRGGLSANWVDV